MKVAITYPADFPLTGWKKEVFHYRLLSMFDKSYFDICCLDQARKDICNDTAIESSELHDDLRVFHCVDFRKMSSAVRNELPAKASQFIGGGVDIRWATGSGIIFKSLQVIGLVGVLVAGLVLGAVGTWASDAIKRKHDNTMFSALPVPIPIAPECLINSTTEQPLPIEEQANHEQTK